MTSGKQQDHPGARVLQTSFAMEELLETPMDSDMRSAVLRARLNAISCGLPLAEYVFRALRHFEETVGPR